METANTGVRHPKGPAKPRKGPDATAFATALPDSSVGAKILVALTGMGLTLFVVFHMIGNLKVLQGPDAINGYAYFLKHDLGALIWVARGGLLFVFVLHLALAIRLKARSAAARSSGRKCTARALTKPSIIAWISPSLHPREARDRFTTPRTVHPGTCSRSSARPRASRARRSSARPSATSSSTAGR